MMNEEKNPGMSHNEIPEGFEPRDELDRLLAEAGKRYFENLKNEKLEDYELDEHQYQKYVAARSACEHIAELNHGTVCDAVLIPTEPTAAIEMHIPMCAVTGQDAKMFGLVIAMCDSFELETLIDGEIAVTLGVRGVYKKKTT